jgi:hypothetical protein
MRYTVPKYVGQVSEKTLMDMLSLGLGLGLERR